MDALVPPCSHADEVELLEHRQRVAPSAAADLRRVVRVALPVLSWRAASRARTRAAAPTAQRLAGREAVTQQQRNLLVVEFVGNAMSVSRRSSGRARCPPRDARRRRPSPSPTASSMRARWPRKYWRSSSSRSSSTSAGSSDEAPRELFRAGAASRLRALASNAPRSSASSRRLWPPACATGSRSGSPGGGGRPSAAPRFRPGRGARRLVRSRGVLQDTPGAEQVEAIGERDALSARAEVHGDRPGRRPRRPFDRAGELGDHGLRSAALERGERQQQQDAAPVAQGRPLSRGRRSAAGALRADAQRPRADRPRSAGRRAGGPRCCRSPVGSRTGPVAMRAQLVLVAPHEP